MMMYRAYWANTWYSCDNCEALVSVLSELGASSFLMASSWVESYLTNRLLCDVDVILYEEEVEL